jgi:hypothetical protein
VQLGNYRLDNFHDDDSWELNEKSNSKLNERISGGCHSSINGGLDPTIQNKTASKADIGGATLFNIASTLRASNSPAK